MKMDPVLRKCLDDIAHTGQSVIYVGAGPDSFCYTVGRTERGLPELLITGLVNPVQARDILNALNLRVTTVVPDGTTVSLGGAYPVKLVEATDPRVFEDYARIAHGFYALPLGMTPRENRILPDMAERIWQVLVEECGCRDTPDRRYEFLHYLAGDAGGFGHEFRFMGKLGFGGKFYNSAGRWYVSCYREDETPERDEMIRRANERIALLAKEAATG